MTTVHGTPGLVVQNTVSRALRRERCIEHRHAEGNPQFFKHRIRDPEAYAAAKAFNEEHGLTVSKERLTAEERVLRLHSNKKSRISLPGGPAVNGTGGVEQGQSKSIAELDAPILESLRVIVGALDHQIAAVRELDGKSAVSVKHLVDAIEYISRSNRALRDVMQEQRG